MSKAINEVAPWDRLLVGQMLRHRYAHYSTIVDRLVMQEHRLLKLCGEKTFETLADLDRRARVIRELGGDATAVETEATALRDQRAEHLPKLALVQAALATARECLKWADMASEGMHWLSISEPRHEDAQASLGEIKD